MTQDQRMGLPSLTAKLQAWQESPISPLNDWFGLSQNWVDHLASAINFLSGDFPGKYFALKMWSSFNEIYICSSNPTRRLCAVFGVQTAHAGVSVDRRWTRL
jgi:hypothetical protein